jgi:hypothetical protein
MNKLDFPLATYCQPHEVTDRCEFMAQGKEWMEVFKIGHFRQCWHYDLRAAYGAVLANWADTRRGRWVQSPEYLPEALYGYSKGIVTIASSFSPISYTTEEIELTPCSTWEAMLTKSEIDFIARWKLGNYKIQDGYWWIPDKPLSYLFRGAIQWLYNHRLSHNGIARQTISLIIQGLYGLTLQRYGAKEGKYFNPQIGLECLVQTRLRCAELCLANSIIPIAIHVDSVWTDKELAIEDSEKLGDWRLCKHSPAISLGTGGVFMDDSDKLKPFAHHYSTLRALIEAEPTATSYVLEAPSIYSLGEACQLNRLDLIGKPHDIKHNIIINAPQKRVFNQVLLTGKDVLSCQVDSEPVKL